MTSLGLQLCGGGMLACAVFTGFHTAEEPQDQKDGHGKDRKVWRAGSVETPAEQVPKRSEVSRRTDVSMATRFRSLHKIVGQITVGGMVVKPGSVPLRSGMNLWEAVEAAGGPNPFGSMYRVKVFRDGESQSYNLSKPEEAAFRLEPNDMVEVPQKMMIGR